MVQPVVRALGLALVIGLALAIGYVARKALVGSPHAQALAEYSTVSGQGFLEQALGRDKSESRVLVLYVFANTDPEYEENFRFFAREGCFPSDRIDYVFVLQRGEGTVPLSRPLPKLPSNAKLLFHENECYDWGAFGWVLQHPDAVDRSLYSYFIFMNSSVRGPFLPTYMPDKRKWVDALLAKIKSDVKLVGCTINCEKGAQPTSDPTAPLRQNPHVQSYVVATDRLGLQLLEEDGQVFSCHRSINDAVYYAELGSSLAILNAGYNIDSLLIRYQGVDWRNTSNWKCNGLQNPYMQFSFDGLNLHPMEVMFPKVKAMGTVDPTNTAAYVAEFAKWRTEQAKLGVVSDMTIRESTHMHNFHHAYKLMISAWRGRECWDIEYYRAQNPDIPAEWPDSEFMKHWLQAGILESRPFRFNCTKEVASLNRDAKLLNLQLTRLALFGSFTSPEALQWTGSKLPH